MRRKLLNVEDTSSPRQLLLLMLLANTPLGILEEQRIFVPEAEYLIVDECWNPVGPVRTQDN